MILRFLKATCAFVSVAIFSLGCSAQPNVGAWSSSNLGKCYSTPSEFMSSNFWEGYEEDENIRQVQLSGASEPLQYFWVSDTTPQINITSTLLSVDKSGKSCVILYVPLSSSISFDLDKDGKLPSQATSIDTAPPDFPTTKITYQKGSDGIYRPEACKHVLGNKESTIKCEEAFSN